MVDKIDLHLDARRSLNRTLNSWCRAASGATRSLYNPLRSQTKLLLSPALFEMADERQHTVKASKGLRNRLKKALGLGSPTVAPPVVAPPPNAPLPPPAASSLPVAKAPVAPVLPAAPAPAVIIDPDEAAKLQAKYTQFRILVIGRANAGKTTLLKRVCNTTEEPSIYDEEKNLVRYRPIVIPHSHRSFTYSSNRPRRCRLGDFCTYLRPDD